MLKETLAIQAQEFAYDKWFLAQRAPGMTEALVDKAFAAGTILRTHLMHPTSDFVGAEDISCLVGLTAARVKAVNAPDNRTNGLDKSVFTRANALFEKDSPTKNIWSASRCAPCSNGFRPGRSCQDAIQAIYMTCKGSRAKRVWALDADLAAAFDQIDHDRLMERLGLFPAREMIRDWLKAGVSEAGKGFAPTEEGTPQSGSISPLLA